MRHRGEDCPPHSQGVCPLHHCRHGYPPPSHELAWTGVGLYTFDNLYSPEGNPLMFAVVVVVVVVLHFDKECPPFAGQTAESGTFALLLPPAQGEVCSNAKGTNE